MMVLSDSDGRLKDAWKLLARMEEPSVPPSLLGGSEVICDRRPERNAGYSFTLRMTQKILCREFVFIFFPNICKVLPASNAGYLCRFHILKPIKTLPGVTLTNILVPHECLF